MDRTQVLPGDQLRIPAHEYTDILQSTSWVKANLYPRAGGDGPPDKDADKVDVRNDSGADRDAFDVVQFADVTIRDPQSRVDGNLQIVFAARLAFYPLRHFGVLMGPVPAGSGGRAWTGGIHPAKVDVQNTHHRRASPAEGLAYLLSDMIGPYEILSRITTLGLQTCIVKKSNRSSIKLIGRAPNGIPAGTPSGSVTVPGSGVVDVKTWDATLGQWRYDTVSMVVFNAIGAVGMGKEIIFSTDDDGVPSVDSEKCD